MSTHGNTASTKEAAEGKPVKPRCDICWMRSDKKTNRLSPLLQCHACHIAVHPECYEVGTISKARRKTWQCWACKAVGTRVKFRERDNLGRRMVHKITHRPVDCCLCGTTDGGTPHAMHPLFDDYGKKARQLRLENGRPTWVHTLCALVVAQHTQGLVYACNRQGFYDGPQAKGDRERKVLDDDSVNSELEFKKDNEAPEGTHHYTYVLEKWYGKQQGHVKIAREHSELRCRGCGKDGKGANVYRFAVQCMANTPEEFKDFKGIHQVRVRSQQSLPEG